jgi:hypothetical protein
LKLANDSGALVEKAALRTVEASSLANGTEVLTGTSKADDIDGGEVAASDFEDVIEPFSVRPVSGEHRAAMRLEFDLPDSFASECSLQAQLESAYPAA